MESFSIGILLFFVVFGLLRHDSKIATAGLLLLLYMLFAFERSLADYERYLEYYDEIKSGFGHANELEPLYVLSCSTAAKMGMSFDQMRYIFCFLEISLLYKVIRQYTKKTALVLALFFIFPAMIEAELFRFLFGMTLIIYALPNLFSYSKKNYIKYFVFVTLAGLFHSSCFIFFIYYLLVVKKRKELVIIVSTLLFLGTMTISADSLFGVFGHLPIREAVIAKYETDSYANTNGVLFSVIKQTLIFSLALVAIIGFKDRCLIHKPSKTDDNAMLLNSRIIDLNLISLLMLIPMYLSSSSQRLVHVVVFYNFIAVANGSLAHKWKFRWIYAFFVSVCLLIFVLFIESSGTVYAFVSHFTEGFLVNFTEQYL